MKLSILLLASTSWASSIGKQNANNFLARSRRANEGYFSEFSAGYFLLLIPKLLFSGDLERECIEEDCNQTEFFEVYDDDTISGPLYKEYLDCKNYIKWDKNNQQSIDSLRACINGGQEPNQGGQVTQRPMTQQSTQSELVLDFRSKKLNHIKRAINSKQGHC